MPHYVTKLGKKITGMSCEAYVFLFCALGKLFDWWRAGFFNLHIIFLPSGKVVDERWDKNHDSNFFLERWEGVATENQKRQFTIKRKSKFSLFKNEISEMKQTKNWC